MVAFLLARLDEDERAARAAAAVAADVALSVPPATVEHVARHDPARVLREVAALRAIVLDSATSPAVLLRLASVHGLHPEYHPAWPTRAS